MLPLALLGVGGALLYSSTKGPSNNTKVKSSVNGKEYQVQNLPDKEDAANKMAELNDKIDKLLKHYQDDPNSMADPRIRTMIERFNPNSLCENDITANSTSYSENKGEKIVVCLRDKNPPYKLVDSNTVAFVLLHEMAHLMTTTIGHTPEFWTNFKSILSDSAGLGIYRPENYAKSPVEYCGMQITDSPI
jgi:predicted metal-dependent hydrolase